MKPIALMSIGLLGSAVAAAGVTGYLAWNNLAGANLRSNQAVTSVAVKPQTPPSLQPIAAPSEAVYTPPSAPSAPAPSQVENDFLFDLTQALQPVEHERLSDTERLIMARQIAEWLKAGADYWQIRSKFDAAYQNEIAGDYAFNREVYIKFAVERFVPDAWIALAPPRQESSPPQDFSDAPDFYEPPYEQPPYEESYEPPYQPPYEESYEPPYEEPPIGIPAPHPVPPPYAQPPYPHPPVARPPLPLPYPDWEPAPYPVPPQPPIAQRPIPQLPIPQPTPQQPPANNPDWYQNPDSPPTPPSPQPPSRDPNVTEISAPSNPTP